MRVPVALLMAPSSSGQSAGSPITTIVTFLAIIMIFYFMILRPQQKRQKEQKKMLEAVKKGDKVVTSSGIHGIVSGVEETAVLVQVADNVKIKFDKQAIAAVTRSAE